MEGGDPKLELIVLKAVVIREGYLQRLSKVVDLSGKDHLASMEGNGESVTEMLLQTRVVTLEVVESIQRWRDSIMARSNNNPMVEIPPPFIWCGVNYLLKLVDDTDFLSNCLPLVRQLGVEPGTMIRNPLMLPDTLDVKLAENTAWDDHPEAKASDNLKEMSDSERQEHIRLQAAERTVVREEVLRRQGKIGRTALPGPGPAPIPLKKMKKKKGGGNMNGFDRPQLPPLEAASDMQGWHMNAQSQLDQLSQPLQSEFNQVDYSTGRNVQTKPRKGQFGQLPNSQKLTSLKNPSTRSTSSSISQKAQAQLSVYAAPVCDSKLLKNSQQKKPTQADPRYMQQSQQQQARQDESKARMRERELESQKMLRPASRSSTAGSVMATPESSSRPMSKQKQAKEDKARPVFTDGDISNFSSTTQAPQVVTLVTATVLTLLAPGEEVPSDVSWPTAQKVMANAGDFAGQINNFDAGNIPQFKIRALQPFVCNSAFRPKKLRASVSKTCGAVVANVAAMLCEWVLSVVRSKDDYLQWLGEKRNQRQEALGKSPAKPSAAQAQGGSGSSKSKPTSKVRMKSQRQQQMAAQKSKRESPQKPALRSAQKDQSRVPVVKKQQTKSRKAAEALTLENSGLEEFDEAAFSAQEDIDKHGMVFFTTFKCRSKGADTAVVEALHLKAYLPSASLELRMVLTHDIITSHVTMEDKWRDQLMPACKELIPRKIGIRKQTGITAAKNALELYVTVRARQVVAAEAIQSKVRQKQARHKTDEFAKKRAKEKEQDERKHAALQIQKANRRKRAKETLAKKKMEDKERKAAVKIQSKSRQKKAKEKVQVMSDDYELKKKEALKKIYDDDKARLAAASVVAEAEDSDDAYDDDDYADDDDYGDDDFEESRPGTVEAEKESGMPPVFSVGDAVEGLYDDGDEWYQGKIEKANADGTFNVLYDDGDQETLKTDAIRAVEIEPVKAEVVKIEVVKTEAEIKAHSAAREQAMKELQVAGNRAIAQRELQVAGERAIAQRELQVAGERAIAQRELQVAGERAIAQRDLQVAGERAIAQRELQMAAEEAQKTMDETNAADAEGNDDGSDDGYGSDEYGSDDYGDDDFDEASRPGTAAAERDSSGDASAALLIQGGIRKKQARAKVDGKRQEHKAAVGIQGQLRKKNAKEKVQAKRTEVKQNQEAGAATLIQGKVRQKDANKRVNNIKEERAREKYNTEGDTRCEDKNTTVDNEPVNNQALDLDGDDSSSSSDDDDEYGSDDYDDEDFDESSRPGTVEAAGETNGENAKDEAAAALKIQGHCRRRQAGKRVKQKKDESAAATQIQNRQRSKKAKKRVEEARVEKK
jgi:hypothetical protein